MDLEERDGDGEGNLETELKPNTTNIIKKFNLFFFSALRRNFLRFFFYYKISLFGCFLTFIREEKLRDFQKNKNYYNHKNLNHNIFIGIQYNFFKRRKNNEKY